VGKAEAGKAEAGKAEAGKATRTKIHLTTRAAKAAMTRFTSHCTGGLVAGNCSWDQTSDADATRLFPYTLAGIVGSSSSTAEQGPLSLGGTWIATRYLQATITPNTRAESQTIERASIMTALSRSDLGQHRRLYPTDPPLGPQTPQFVHTLNIEC
jgi:hypothetical protein